MNKNDIIRIALEKGAIVGTHYKLDLSGQAFTFYHEELFAFAEAMAKMPDEIVDLLERMFSAYEDGDPCYENPDECEGFIGNAVILDEVTFNRIADILNELRPRVTAPKPKE